eukprot:3681315-Pleurochrysis_carterae.AAC.2
MSSMRTQLRARLHGYLSSHAIKEYLVPCACIPSLGTQSKNIKGEEHVEHATTKLTRVAWISPYMPAVWQRSYAQVGAP